MLFVFDIIMKYVTKVVDRNTNGTGQSLQMTSTERSLYIIIIYVRRYACATAAVAAPVVTIIFLLFIEKKNI